MPIKQFATLVLPILLCLCTALQADTVTLKSGEKLEGKIVNETDAEVTMSVQVSPTIKDERVVKKEDIAKLEKVQPDEEAWVLLANLTPGTESLERDEYDRMKTALSYFTNTFPKSSHAALAQSRLDQFTVEQMRVSKGEVKLNGQWLSKEKVQEERIQIGGKILLNRMKRAAGAGQFTDAMAIFDQFEKGFAGSTSYPEAVELGRRVLASLWPAVQQRELQLKRHMEDEKQRLMTTLNFTEHAQLDAMIRKEQAATEATLAAIERTGVKWFPLQPANARSLTALATRVTSETKRLSGLDIEKMQGSVKAAQEAEKALSLGNFDDADRALKDATSTWSANELAKRLQGKLADAKKTAAPRTGTPTPTPKPKSSSPSASVPIPEVPSEVEQPAETPFFKRPSFFIALAVVVAFGVIAGKMIAKSRATTDNLIDK